MKKRGNASHKPNDDPSPAEILRRAKEIRDEKDAARELLLARQMPAKVATVRPLDLKAAKVM